MGFYKSLCVQTGVLLVMVFLAQGAVPSLDQYLDCANTINNITLKTACQDVDNSMTCMKTLADSMKSCPDGQEEKANSFYCGVLDGSNHAPMVGEMTSDLSICGKMSELTLCYNAECGDGGKQFKQDTRRGYSSSEDACSIKGQKECVDPVVSSTLTSRTCGDYLKAKNCFVDKLMDCGGSGSNQIAADLILIGLDEQLKECKRKGIMQASFCDSNPMDGNDKLKAMTEINQENCKMVHEMGKKLGQFSTECKKAPSYLKDGVYKTIVGINAARVECYTKYGCGNSGQNLKMSSITLTAIVGAFIYLIV